MGKQYSERTRSVVESLEQRLVLAAGALDTTFGSGGTALAQFKSPVLSQMTDLAVRADDYVVAAGVIGFPPTHSTPKPIGVIRVRPDGSSDPAFGTLGSVRVDLGTNTVAWSVAVAPDNKIIVAGYIGDANSTQDALILRLNVDGSLDSSFDADGIKIIDFGQVTDTATEVAVLSDGRIILAGTYGTTAYVARLNLNGSYDPTFAGTGLYSFSFGTSSPTIADLDIDSSGRYLLTAKNGLSGSIAVALARINSNGTPDSSFDGDGVLLDRVGTANSTTSAIRADGRIVIGTTAGDLTILQYNANGTRDTTFGTAGAVTISDTKWHAAEDITIQTDGKLIVGTQTSTKSSDPLITGSVHRLNSNGSLDSSFGVGGRREITAPVFAVALRTDAKIAVTGFNVGLVTSTGQLDDSFGQNGYQTGNFGTAISAGPVFMVRQPDGKFIVSAGWVEGTTTRVGLMRLNSDGSVDATFGTGGQLLYPFGTAAGTTSPRIEHLLVQPDGRIVAIGWANGIQVVRLNTNGSLDLSFGTGGRWQPPVGITAQRMFSGTLQGDGKLVLMGRLTQPFNEYAILRLNINGTLDTTFNGTGYRAILDRGGRDFKVALDSSGRILFSEAVGGGIHVMRLTTAGALDLTFNGTGEFFQLGILNTGSLSTNNLLVLPNGQILAGGTNQSNPLELYATLTRINPNGTRDSTFNPSGVPAQLTGEVISDVGLASDGSLILVLARIGFGRPFAINADGSNKTNYSSNTTLTGTYNVVGNIVVVGTSAFILGHQNHANVGNIAVTKLVGSTQPTAVTGGPYAVNEGASLALDGSGSFEPNDTISKYEWDLDYDGVTFNVDVIGATPTFSAPLVDGQTIRNIALRVTGSFNQTHIAATTVTIANVASTLPAWMAPGSAAAWNASTQTLTVAGAATINANPGLFGDNPIFVLDNDDELTVDTGAGGARQVQISQLSLSDNAKFNFTPAASSYLLVVNALSINDSASLDLDDNSMIVTSSDVASVEAQVASAFNFFAWDGPGIRSSASLNDANNMTTLGVLDGATYVAINGSNLGGRTVTDTDVIVKYTYYGDADLSGVVDGTDYALIDTGFANALTGWFNGDFDHSGVVDGTDYALIDTVYVNQVLAMGYLFGLTSGLSSWMMKDVNDYTVVDATDYTYVDAR